MQAILGIALHCFAARTDTFGTKSDKALSVRA